MTRDLFIEGLLALRDQYDNDVKRAQVLSDIYGTDIDPVDNSTLGNYIIGILERNFDIDVAHFCYEQDFGRKVGKSIETFWDEAVSSIKVVYSVVPPKSS